MNSGDIKRSLQPFADFAPAILKAADICEAAEQAEKRLKELGPQIVEAERAIKDAAEKAASYEGKTAKARAAFQDELKAIEDHRKVMTDQLAPLKKQLADMQADIAKAEKAKAQQAADLEAQIAALIQKRDKAEADFQRVLKRHAG